MAKRRQTRYVGMQLTERQAEQANAALDYLWASHHECDVHVPVWVEESIWRVRAMIINGLEHNKANPIPGTEANND